MARIRSIKPDFFASYTTAKLSIEARYLFVGLLTEADDYGILIDSPKRICGAVFPHDASITEDMVEAWLKEISKARSIRRYKADGGRYISFNNWDSHQKISHKGAERLPRPSGGLPESLPKETGNAPF